MCKHVAAVIIDVTLENKVEAMLENASGTSRRIIMDEDAWRIFGL